MATEPKTPTPIALDAQPAKDEPEGAFALEEHRRQRALQESLAYAKAAEAAKGAK